jgi:hypothetical protein
MSRRLLRAAAVAALLAGACGCVTVKPWDKDVLAQRNMEFSAEAGGQAFTAHALSVHEESIGADGGSGGGCGCR